MPVKLSEGGNDGTRACGITTASITTTVLVTTVLTSMSLPQYASRAKRIKTNAIVNEDTNDRIIRELRAEIERLRKEVAGQQKSASPVVQSAADEEVQRLRAQLQEQQRMIEEMNLQWQEQLREQVMCNRNVLYETFALCRGSDTRVRAHTHAQMCSQLAVN